MKHNEGLKIFGLGKNIKTQKLENQKIMNYFFKK